MSGTARSPTVLGLAALGSHTAFSGGFFTFGFEFCSPLSRMAHPAPSQFCTVEVERTKGNFQELGGEVAMTKTNVLCSPGQEERPEGMRKHGEC